jgi:hypothetical protein
MISGSPSPLSSGSSLQRVARIWTRSPFARPDTMVIGEFDVIVTLLVTGVGADAIRGAMWPSAVAANTTIAPRLIVSRR